ncbi:sensor domain-containing diguanylate cyclase [Herbaspirillum sp. CF444]|uniref:sensor domain-containing diguanylate cyclase n=1 Tax=Herbaspirillum sp. CF444 TaxID=1144319 RepID=UPI0012F9743F|nr:GGDEF domain-containing protein [Herbaspirillum sp. CF444]
MSTTDRDAAPAAPAEPSRQEELARKPASVANLAIGFILLVCALFIALDLIQLGLARKQQINDTNVAVANIARALQRHADDTLKSTDVSLIGMIKLIETEGTGPRGLGHLATLMSQNANALPQVHAYFAYDEHGRSLVDSTPLYVQQNVSDRDYFMFHRNNPSRDAYVGPLIKNRTTGSWIITVSRRLDHPDGSFAGVIMAALDLEYFKTFYDTFDIGKEGVIFLGMNKGTVLVRRPLYEQYVGKSMIDTPIFRDHVSKNASGLVTFRSTIDNQIRLTAYDHLQHYPLYVFVALSKEEALSGWVEDTIMHACGIAILVLTLSLLGLRLVRQIKLRARTEVSLREARDSLNELNATLQRLALEDGLTGLANRRHFDLALQEELSRATRNASSLALIMIDVDRFKQYNDIYGHAAGDECLRQIGRAVKKVQRRSGDLAARYGGEELAVLLPDTNLAAALGIAEQLRQTIDALQIAHAGNPIGNVTVSAGIDALMPARADDLPETLIRQADQALYQAKKQGRNQVCAATDLA